MHLCAKIVCFFVAAVFDDYVNVLYLFCLCFCVLVCANECLYKFAIKNYKYNT